MQKDHATRSSLCCGNPGVSPVKIGQTGSAKAPFDLVITHGHIIDGTGSPWYSADVGISDGRIAAIGDLAGAPAKQTIDAQGKVVAPGFIDMLGQSELTILVDPRLPSKIFPGDHHRDHRRRRLGRAAQRCNDCGRPSRLRTPAHHPRLADASGNTSRGLRSRGWGSTCASYVGRDDRYGEWCSAMRRSIQRRHNWSR